MWFSENFSDKFSGDSCEGPPVPISNTVVKLANAESTCLETSREDRKSLITQKSSPTGGLFYLHLYGKEPPGSTRRLQEPNGMRIGKRRELRLEERSDEQGE